MRISPKARTAAARAAVGVVTAAVVLAAMAWLSGTFHRDRIRPRTLADADAAASAPAAGTVFVVQRRERPRDVEVVGSVQSESRTNIASRIVANVAEMRVNAGDAVKRGDLLVVLDDAAPRARVEQAREMLRAAEAGRKLAETELGRVATLRDTGAVSRNQVDEWEAKLAVANSDAARARQAIAEADVGLTDAQLKAPFDGIVIDRLVEPGDQAFPGRPLLTLYDPSRLRLEASVREAYTGRLSLGQKIAVRIDAIGADRTGSVRQIVPASDPASRSFLVKVHLDDPKDLYPGMYGRMSVPLGAETRIEVPESMVRRVGQLTFVSVLEDGRAARRAVRLGRVAGADVEVLAGLREGERVVGG